MEYPEAKKRSLTLAEYGNREVKVWYSAYNCTWVIEMYHDVMDVMPDWDLRYIAYPNGEFKDAKI